MGVKRSHAEMSGRPKKQDAPTASDQPQSPFMPIFETFRAELDEHHARREEIIKASRDITAASKKIIFTLQRTRKLKEPLPQHVTKTNKDHHDIIAERLKNVAKHLQGINSFRYARQISGGCQEWMEAASFQHYLETARLLSYEESRALLEQVSRDEEGRSVVLSPEDYVLGIYDMTGELMRFAITAMATQGLPTIPLEADDPNADAAGAIEVDSSVPVAGQRNVLTDMRLLRSALEGIDAGSGPFAKDAEKKMEVMRTSVEKVEKSLYGLIVRGAERPKGWMPDMDAGGGRAIEVEG
ncbi:hypothetical protein B0A50_01565 [Salinomyces thailandicus]|uniref:Translin-associated protein X n=1 Tax=Salinomyces thailandicus TaxID=706561 RepID=A0A4U0UBA9_9PEZI|nr:hypothetical protein B0A50_01565 [Salinomyces thailandica]